MEQNTEKEGTCHPLPSSQPVLTLPTARAQAPARLLHPPGTQPWGAGPLNRYLTTSSFMLLLSFNYPSELLIVLVSREILRKKKVSIYWWMNEWRKIWYVYIHKYSRLHTNTHTIEYFSARIKKNILPFETCMELEGTMQSEISDTERQILYALTVCGI